MVSLVIWNLGSLERHLSHQPSWWSQEFITFFKKKTILCCLSSSQGYLYISYAVGFVPEWSVTILKILFLLLLKSISALKDEFEGCDLLGRDVEMRGLME